MTCVSILVVLEFGLWGPWCYGGGALMLSFNPCCFGIRSVSSQGTTPVVKLWVSILVVLEFGLWGRENTTGCISGKVSILVVLEFGLWGCTFDDNNVLKSWFQSLLFWNSVCEEAAVYDGEGKTKRFQSLLFWNSVCEVQYLSCLYESVMFQSLLFWNSVCEGWPAHWPVMGLEFQSLLFWNSVCEWGCLVLWQVGFEFQSLLFWNSVCEGQLCQVFAVDHYVSILVVLEFGLWAVMLSITRTIIDSFNPCCFGIRSVRLRPVWILSRHPEFQSLLFWNSVCELFIFATGIIINVFQSLLFWNSVCEASLIAFRIF